MPRNNQYTYAQTSSVLYQCPCGYEKMSNDAKTSRSCMERHIRYCSVGKEIKDTAVYLQTREHPNTATDSLKTTTFVAPKNVVANFNKK